MVVLFPQFLNLSKLKYRKIKYVKRWVTMQAGYLDIIH